MLVSTAENGSYEFCDRWKSVYWNLKWRGRERLRLKKLMYYSAMDEVVRSLKIRIFRVSFLRISVWYLRTKDFICAV